ncbi:MAG: hypothetical protein KAV82_03230 [Phycisphaerae bacterium]|nr:hypothetical protein [Phycisphaerae bacterium]
MGWFEAPRCAVGEGCRSHPCRLSRIERHTIFREMAKGELCSGRIGKRRRRRLIVYAGRLGIDRIEASELIGEARRALGLPATPTPWELSADHPQAAKRRLLRWLIGSIVFL